MNKTPDLFDRSCLKGREQRVHCSIRELPEKMTLKLRR